VFFLNNRATLPVDEVAQTSLEPTENYTHLLQRLFRSSDTFSGPDPIYENEAWAPEPPQVRLFNKQRSLIEE
jgi:hypothetical protein